MLFAAPFLFLLLEVPMEAEFFVIMPAMSGWDLYHGMEGCGRFAKWGDALEAADVVAGARHDAVGVSTAVV